MKTWSIESNEDEGDTDTMPTGLSKSLMPAKMGIKNPLRENSAKTLDKASMLAQMPVPHRAPMPYYPYPPQYYSAYNGQIHPYTQPGYLLPPHHAAESLRWPRYRSSSLPSEFDICIDKLTEYIDWLIKQHSTKSEQLTAYLETLKDKNIVFEIVESIDWNRWEA